MTKYEKEIKISHQISLIIFFKKSEKRVFYNEVQNVLVRACLILEYGCTLYIDKLAIKREVSLKRRIASRGWHVYGKTIWKDPKKGEPVLAEKETNQNTIIIDRVPIAWKLKLKIKLTAYIITLTPKEISRAILFFINQGVEVTFHRLLQQKV